MHNDLTRKDLELMKKELDERRIVLRPQLLEQVKIARGFGDLSENFEYKNESRIRYLENMIRTAHIIDDDDGGHTGGVGLYDKVTVLIEDEGSMETYQIVTTMRQDALHGLISRESPVGKALLGRREGERVHIQVDEAFGYDMLIQKIEKGEDDGSIPLNKY